MAAARAVSGSVRKASGGSARNAARQSAAKSRTAASKSAPPPYQSSMPRPSNQKARSRAAQSGGGAVPRSPRSPSLRSGIDLAIRDELAERDEARIHMAATVVELDRVDRAGLRAGQFGDEDVVRSEEHTSELQTLISISSGVF